MGFLNKFFKKKNIDDRFLFQELLSNTSDYIYFKDRESRFIQSSQQLAKRLGAGNADDVIGKTDFDFFSEEHARQAFEDEQRIIKTGEPIIGIVEKETFPDGRILWSSTSKFPLVDKDEVIIGTVGISRDITAQIQAEAELKESKEKIQRTLREKEILLAEVHHRVKNNLAVILALIELQKYQLEEDGKPVPHVLLTTKARIKSIANVHELLYTTENFASINIKKLLVKLSEDIKASYNTKSTKIDFNLEIDDIHLNSDQTIPFCLLLNELIQNSYKHAFNNQSAGIISINITLEDEEVVVVYQDNGIGMNGNIEEAPDAGNSLGLILITALGNQIEAETLDKIADGEGFSYHFKFKPHSTISV